MEYLFVPALANLSEVNFSKIIPKSTILFKKIGIISTIQYSGFIEKLKHYLESQGKQVFVSKSNNSQMVPGQILGCNQEAALNIQDKVECFIYLGSGHFHIYGLAMKTEKPIFILNPSTNQFSEFDRKEITKLKQRQKAQEIKFLSASNIGILVSIKQGQLNLNKALKLKQEIESKNYNKNYNQNRKAYIFLFNTLDNNQFFNFLEIESWVNTACPGIFYDCNVYNY